MAGPYDDLEKLFHQPNRLAIMSELCGSEQAMTFGDLKDACDLTDGNLSRHLQMLEKAGVIRIKKSFVDSKPLTTVQPTARGRTEFLEYLAALEEVLKEAAERVGAKVDRRKTIISGKLKTSSS